MAHDHMMAMISAGCHDGNELLMRAWEYADAMQAEADKRENKETCDKSLNIDSKELHVEEWQPDWGVAPEWTNYWFKDQDNIFWWSKLAPYFLKKQVSKIIINNSNEVAPSFGYTGDWRDSLRKRPQ